MVYDINDISAAPASGTFRTIGMIIVPCSMKTAAGICYGYSDNLLLRAADVTIKERRKLVLVARECPLSTIHLRNMLVLSQMGVEIVPPMLSYYNHPKKLEDCTNHIVGKILDRFDIDSPYFKRWEGKSHVGAISYTNQHQDVQTIQFIGHRDGAVSENWAVRLRKISKGTVVVCCGIHYDHVSQKEIEQIVEKTNELLKEVEEKIVMYKVI